MIKIIVKCKTKISINTSEEGLTTGEEYEVLGKQHGFSYDMYLIKNDNGELKACCEMLFEIVKEV